MGTPYVSEIRMMAFNFPPKGWAFCNGQSLAIQNNQALFSLLGTTYGGDGIRTFQLPNLQGRVPLHMGAGYVEGQIAGEVSHTLTMQEMAPHTHRIQAKNAQADITEAGIIPGPTVWLAQSATDSTPVKNVQLYGTLPINTAANFASGAISMTGSSQSHPNQQPYLVINFCISLQGIFPTRS